MQLLFDLFPLLVFFAAYWAYGIYFATGAIMIALLVQIAYQWFRHRKVNNMLLVSGGLVVVFGTLTLILRNPIFIQWKVTVVYWLFGIAFLASQFLGKKTLVERALGEALSLDQAVWRQLNVVWIATFFVLGAVNLYVMYNFSQAIWVSYKVFGTIGLSLLSLIGQFAWIYFRSPEAFADRPTQNEANARREAPPGEP